MAAATCPACIQGGLDEGTPRGEVVQIAGVPCYLTVPPAAACTKRALILGSDIFGYELINLRLIADACAERGFLVAVPDYLRGEPVPMRHLSFAEDVAGRSGVSRFLVEHPLQVVRNVAAALRQEHGVEEVAFCGFCFGGKVGLLLAGTPGVVDAVSVAHPGGAEVRDFEAMGQVPVLFLCAGSDPLFPAKLVARAKAVLQAKGCTAPRFKWVHHEGTVHGYAVRALKGDATALAARADALQQALAFFDEVLPGARPAPGGQAQ